MSNVSLEDIVSLAKRRGFIYPGSDIYGGLAGIYDYGPLGVRLKHNLQKLWWQRMVGDREDVYPLDSAILMPERVWEASGHLSGFTDPMVECSNCHKTFREDHLDKSKPCPNCGKSDTFGKVRQFNLLFPVKVGASEDATSTAYLRGETAQGIYTNFKNIVDSFSPSLPFGIAQIGKAFRNEISPRDFLFRQREFEQMEMQLFIRPEMQDQQYEAWRNFAWDFLTKDLDIDEKSLQWHEHAEDERAHYAKAAHDIEFNYPFGFKELWGTHNRTDYDLKKHSEFSGKDLSYFDQTKNEKFVPYIIESSVGLDRMFLAAIANAYTEDEVNGEKRIYLKLPADIAPVKVAVSPLLKNKPELVEKAKEVYKMLKDELGAVMWDDNGNIGKRYRRQDEIGTPYCVTIDFETLENDTVTVRDRDTTNQARQKISEISLES